MSVTLELIAVRPSHVVEAPQCMQRVRRLKSKLSSPTSRTHKSQTITSRNAHRIGHSINIIVKVASAAWPKLRRFFQCSVFPIHTRHRKERYDIDSHSMVFRSPSFWGDRPPHKFFTVMPTRTRDKLQYIASGARGEQSQQTAPCAV